MNKTKRTIAVAKGDGIGPEIMDAVLNIFKRAGVPLRYHFIGMGKATFEQGFSSGLTPEARNTIEETGILFKGPMETPKGKGVKSINVTARKVWNTYANVRRFKTLKGVDTIFSKAGIPVNITMLRENIEDTYGGVEYLQTYDVAVAFRFITRPGSEQFLRFAFEYARREGINKITCGHKANIMKLTDGIFLSKFYEIAKDFPDIEATDLIVDDMAMKLVRNPEKFTLIVLTNLQGDILSDLCAGLVGGLGFAPSANIGDNISIFEAVHGTAPDIAGKNIANPTSLLLSGLMLLRHLGLISYADTIENALLYTLEEGKHTGDFGIGKTTPLSTSAFAEAIISNLGKAPAEASHVVDTGTEDFDFMRPEEPEEMELMYSTGYSSEKIIGTDIFVCSLKKPELIASEISPLLPDHLKLELISNRGTQVWPAASKYTDTVALFSLRMILKDRSHIITSTEILSFAASLSSHIQVVGLAFLKEWGDMKGYSAVQGA
jgi:isocitrate dehydrogenase